MITGLTSSISLGFDLSLSKSDGLKRSKFGLGAVMIVVAGVVDIGDNRILSCFLSRSLNEDFASFVNRVIDDL